MALTFNGGIHPNPNKRATENKPLEELSVQPKKVFLHLDMCDGDPAIPIVSAGDRVAVGQVIAKPSSDRSAPIHASVSGLVTGIESCEHPWHGEKQAIVIANNGKNTPAPPMDIPDYRTATQEQLISVIRNAGIVGMGGSAIPTAWKIETSRGHLDTLIVNAVECEPMLTADRRVLHENGYTTLIGIRALSKVLGVKHTIIASQTDKLRALEHMERAIARDGERIRIRTVPTTYPLGAERLLVKALTGREMPADRSILDTGCIVFNISTVHAIGQAVRNGTPLTRRAITLGGGCVANPQNLWVPIGTPIATIIESSGGLLDRPYAVVMGGPFMGITQKDFTAPILKNTGGLLCLSEEEKPNIRAAQACLQCGQCLAACPMRLAPALVQRALENKSFHKLRTLHPQDCMECGNCTYVCPCHIQLTDIMRSAKSVLSADQKGGEE